MFFSLSAYVYMQKQMCLGGVVYIVLLGYSVS